MLLDLLVNQPPTDFWHDPFIQFVIYVVVTLIIGIATVLTTILVFRKQRSKKEISYQVISDAPIVNVIKAMENRIKIVMDSGQELRDARLIVLKVRSSGNAAVRRDDYDEPIQFVFEGSEVVGSDILATEPDELIKSIDKTTFIICNQPGKIDEDAISIFV